MCTEAAWLGADGGLARYRLRLEPALSLLRLCRDSYILQDKTVQDIVTELLADYPQLRFDFDVTQEQLPRAICTQYRESDLEFLTRLLASEGLNWRFEHDQPDEESQDGQARHKLVIFDAAAQAPDTPNGAELRFHGTRATDTDDAIDRFAAKRRVQANAVSISSWDPAQLLAPAAAQTSSLDAGELPTLAIYDGSGERIACGEDAGAAADPHSRLMLQALELDNKLFEGAGAVRRLAAGHTFTLTQHDRYPDGDNGFTVLCVEHEACNNFQPQIKSVGSTLAEGTYRNTFGCVRDTVAIVPQAAASPTPSTALGPQTALAVGIADAVAHTTRDHQVLAKHEQGVILQPLIYDDPTFSGKIDLQRSKLVNWATPPVELVFHHGCATNDASLKSVAPKEIILEDYAQRMAWITNAAEQFHLLMQVKKAYMEGELQTMAGWVDLSDEAEVIRAIEETSDLVLDKAAEAIDEIKRKIKR